MHRALFENKYQVKNGKKTLLLNKEQKAEDVRLCSNWLVSPPNWKKMIFTDEKNFNLDGPDNWKTCMEEKTKIHVNKRQCGGGSHMVWGVLLPTGQIFVKK